MSRPSRVLDNERGYTEAAITDAIRQMVDNTIAGLEALDEKIRKSNRDLREEIRDLKREVACLTSLLAELRKEQASTPLDLPRLPLRTAREIN
jgi:predicted RNase H-like nuclease (RuvC/YqgF family)